MSVKVSPPPNPSVHRIDVVDRWGDTLRFESLNGRLYASSFFGQTTIPTSERVSIDHADAEALRDALTTWLDQAPTKA